MNTNEHLEWRYATKKFDPTKKIPAKEVAELLETLRLSPSSFGLQPWKFVVVANEKLRAELKPHAWNQAQVTDASHLLVLCSLKKMDEAYIKQFVTHLAEVRAIPRQSLEQYEQIMLGFLNGKTEDQISHWMQNQVYIALGVLLVECARRKIDACPMEGFDSKKFDEVLGLDKKGITSVVLCPIGYRAADDHNAAMKKVRFDKKDLFIEM